MLSIFLVFTCLSLAVANPVYRGEECAVSTKYLTGDLQEPQPLILTRDENVTRFLYPTDEDGTLRVPKGQSIYLACPGKGNYLNATGEVEVEAICLKKKIFSVNGAPRNFSSLFCNRVPRHMTLNVDTEQCLGDQSLISIGFNVSGELLETLEVCRNDETFVTYYTKFELTKSIGAVQRKYPRPRWIAGEHYPRQLNVDGAYKFGNQFKTLASILNSEELAQKHLRRSVQFLARGHMTARGDFVYATQQLSTFYHLNAAPQWQSFNGGNWNQLEQSIRNLAADRGLDLVVYTGVYGQMTMTDAEGRRKPIHLYVNGTKKFLPVPRIYWKVIYDPITGRGTAFVGLNDPFIKKITKGIYLCPDVSSNIPWLSWNPRDITAGISYACTIDSLRKQVPTIPELEVTDLLV